MNHFILRIETKVFIALSNAIESLFPGELACSYYTLFKSENGTTVQTGGTLLWHYNYVVEKLRSQNLLDRAYYSKKKEKPVTQPLSMIFELKYLSVMCVCVRVCV